MSTAKESNQTNPYYIYRLSQPMDLLEETFQRRISKCHQAKNRGFLFHINGQDTEIANLVKFIQQFGRANDAVMIEWNFYNRNFESFKTFTEKSSFAIFFTITNEADLSSALTLLKNEHCNILLQLNSKKEFLSTLKLIEPLPEISSNRVSFFPQKFDLTSGKTICTLDYLDLLQTRQLSNLPRNHLIPFWNDNVSENFELEPLVDLNWQIKSQTYRLDSIKVSIIIPTYNNARFLVNVIAHLAEQDANSESYEIIVVDDGSEDGTSEILKKFVQSHDLNINLRFYFWSKKDSGRGPQFFFRPGQARNLAAHFALGEYLVFLDSDMLVPPKFVDECRTELNRNDLIQFQRFHINQKLSLTNPRLKDITISKDCYIEEKHYWNQLFNCDDWNLLPQKWKYVCTYALGIRRDEFFKMGRFKRHFISYGFEDTDLGFRMYKEKKKFKLIKTPLLHLTNYSQMQYQNSAFKRHELLSVTAKLFFLDHLDFEIGTTLKTFLGGEKGLIDRFKDRFLNN